MGERRCPDLAEECWMLIMNRVDHHSRLESLSLVSKQFLSITNRLRSKFTLTDTTLVIHGATLPNLINNRFHHLKTLDFSLFHGDLEAILVDIAATSFNMVDSLDLSNHKRIPTQMLSAFFGKLRVLKCANVCRLSDADLVDLVTVFPLLEELDISYPNSKVGECSAVTDVGMEALWSGLRNLRVLNISGNHFVTDGSLVGLALNCLSLTQVCVVDCCFITYTGIQFMLSSCRDLSAMQVNGVNAATCVGDSTFGKALTALHFSDSVISDDFLHSIARAAFPLKRFGLSRCTNFTFSGISMLLCTYPSLDYLALVEQHLLTDQCILKLTPCLTRLLSIKLDACSRLTNFTFFTLVNNCRSLESIEITTTCMGDEDSFMEFIIGSPRIKSLNLARNLHLTDGYLKYIASACPNLEMLDLSANSGITDQGIAYVLKACGEIRNLQISDCGGIKSIGTGAKLPKLEVLRVTRSGLNDEGLVTIWSRCSGLLKLDLEGCVGATTKRVEEVVQNCERLREINLKGCCNVDVFSVATVLMISKPSLMKIITPRNFSITNNLQKHLLSHGCLLSAQ